MKTLQEHLTESTNESRGYKNLNDVSRVLISQFDFWKDPDEEIENLWDKNLDPDKLFKLIRKFGKNNITDNDIVIYFTMMDDDDMWIDTINPDEYTDETNLAKDLAEDILIAKKDGNLHL